MKEQKEPENNRNDKEVKTLNFKELQERAKGRNFDQITVVSRDIFQDIVAEDNIKARIFKTC